jgi:hypothetical protein
MVIGFIYFGNCEVGFWLSGEGHFGVYDKIKIGKAELVGLRSRGCHVLRFSVYFNLILDSGSNVRAIGLV